MAASLPRMATFVASCKWGGQVQPADRHSTWRSLPSPCPYGAAGKGRGGGRGGQPQPLAAAPPPHASHRRIEMGREEERATGGREESDGREETRATGKRRRDFFSRRIGKEKLKLGIYLLHQIQMRSWRR